MKPIAETDASGNVVSFFVYGTSALSPDTMDKDGVTYRFIRDVQGSVRLVVDSATGAIAQRLDYDSFGNVLTDTNPGFQPFGFQSGGVRFLFVASHPRILDSDSCANSTKLNRTPSRHGDFI